MIRWRSIHNSKALASRHLDTRQLGRLAFLTCAIWSVVHLALLASCSIAAAKGAEPIVAAETSSQNDEEDDEGGEYSASEVLFARRIGPLFREKCIACHGQDPDVIEASIDFRSLEGITSGGDSGEPGIVAGKPSESSIYLAAARGEELFSAMPPKESEALDDEQLQWLSDWISSGAKWPSEERIKLIESHYSDAWSVEDGVMVTTSGGLDANWTNRRYDPEGLWAYQPLRDFPRHSNSANAIDQFIKAALPPGVDVASRADRQTLLRRATFDLTGLPPTPEQTAAFLSDSASDKTAFASLVDRLLDSPHYGERMAQHWLDVTRYADSSGFANDFERGNAWRYRDYVVRAFNDDLPYDQFVREQIAGDEIDPSDPENLIATGFLRMGPWELTGMEVAKVARQRFLDDVTNAVGETFLGHSLQCCRCHDHKFDPIPTQDYYSIQAVFATTQLADRHAEFLDDENILGFEEQRWLEEAKKYYQTTLEQLDEVLVENATAWMIENGKDLEPWQDAIARAKQNGNSARVFKVARNMMAKAGVAQADYPPVNVGFTPQQFGLERVARKGLQRLKWEFDRYQPFALGVYDGRTPQMTQVVEPLRVPEDAMTKGELEQTAILSGGDPFSPTQKVAPGTLSVIGEQVSASIPKSIQGRREAFANWVADPHNPLTSRVLVNRIWLWHFGKAIAGNPNNFGASGKYPTHPELLDWLATELINNGWSIKHLHRQIMNSDTYCRSTSLDVTPNHDQHEAQASTSGNYQHEAQASSPNTSSGNTTTSQDILAQALESYAVFSPRRLSAEELRDAMLAVSGELNPALGGIPCRPIINSEVALQPRQVMGTFAAAWTPNPLPEQRNRRSVYVLKLRGLVAPGLEVFNLPSPDFSCERRDTSTVTPQVFALFNSQNSQARAMALANLASEATRSRAETIEWLFYRLFARAASDGEVSRCLDHWQHIESMLPSEPEPPALPPREVVREAVEENTGENFTFTETLYAIEEFEPDLQPADVDRKTRALADLCLVLMNSNEFVYVY